MTVETFTFFRHLTNYMFIILEPLFLFILIYRRKHIPKAVFIIFVAFSIFWIVDTLSILTDFKYYSKKAVRTFSLLVILIQFLAPFSLYYFYVVPDKWKVKMKWIFGIYFILAVIRISYNMLVLKTYSCYNLDPIGYFLFLPIVIISIFKIKTNELNYKSYASPRFFLMCAYLFYFISNTALMLFRYTLYDLDVRLLNILLTIQLFTWFVTLFFQFKAILTFDAEKEGLIKKIISINDFS